MQIPEDFGPDFEGSKKPKDSNQQSRRPLGEVANVVAKMAAAMAGLSSVITAFVFLATGAEDLSWIKIAAIVATVTIGGYFLVLFSIRKGESSRIDG